MTALSVAVNENLEEVVQLLLQHNADPNIESELGLPLYMATSNPDSFPVFLLLLNCPRISINKQDCYGMSSLHVACINNNVQAVEALIQRGAHTNLSSVDGETPIFSCMTNAILFHKMYVTGGANIDVVDFSNLSPLELLFVGVHDEPFKSTVIQPIYNVIVDESREPIHFSAAAMANVLECEHIMPSMVDQIINTAASVDFTSMVYRYGYNCQTLSIHFGLVEALDKIISVTGYNPKQDPMVYLAVFNVERPSASFEMFKYLVERLHVDMLGYVDDSGFPLAYYALTNKCIDCFLYIMNRTPKTLRYPANISSEMAYAALKTQSMAVIKVAVHLFDFMGTVPAPMNIFDDPDTYINVISAYLLTIHPDDTGFLQQALQMIVHEQGLPNLTNAPQWFKSSALYDTIQRYDTLMYRSLASVPIDSRKLPIVQKFKQFRRHYR